MMGDGEVGMDAPSEALAARMTCWSINRRLSQTYVSLYASLCDGAMGRRDLAC